MAITNKAADLQDKYAEILLYVKDLSFDKIDSYIDNNVNNLVEAKAFLKKITKVLIILTNETYGEL